MKNLFLNIVTVLLLLGCQATVTETVSLGDTEQTAVLKLDRDLLQAQIVERDPALLMATASESFRVLAPGGKLEGLEESVRGVVAWDVAGIEITKQEAVMHGDVAIVTGRLDIDGTMQPIGRWGPLKYIATYQWVDGNWKLLARSLTPCLEKAIELGFC